MTLPGENLLGQIRGVYLSRATDGDILRRKVASGGAVTAMLLYALEKNLVDGVVAAKRTRGLAGEPVVARTREELLETAGNSWNIVPFEEMIKARIEEEGLKRVAVVCLPCQAQLFGQMREFPLLEADLSCRVRYVVSLFCRGIFVFGAFINHLRIRYGIRGEEITNVRLGEGHLIIQRGREELVIPLREVCPYLQTGCLICSDYTGVWSDVSAGSVEREPGWTVLITRNRRGEKLVRGAEREGYLELRDGFHVLEDVLREAKNKLERARENMKRLL
ncbi:Coenzyme F420 hydrogenase/dehydrogenase, beta subunit C-terminal domain [Thermococcus sp.]|uniref:Coenzyme F420 hydrogenase/dehydrogenase, beta subunit C-terminal domain n=1 Tax=Thermococcus sp. TaxID=35749 RepID=UPI00260D13D7|nr:Coenzyme F420 hydrogenase/dehydrogenase, beta subunit C-terminal domain [Thermococcus sp.]